MARAESQAQLTTNAVPISGVHMVFCNPEKQQQTWGVAQSFADRTSEWRRRRQARRCRPPKLVARLILANLAFTATSKRAEGSRHTRVVSHGAPPGCCEVPSKPDASTDVPKLDDSAQATLLQEAAGGARNPDALRACSS